MESYFPSQNQPPPPPPSAPASEAPRATAPHQTPPPPPATPPAAQVQRPTAWTVNFPNHQPPLPPPPAAAPAPAFAPSQPSTGGSVAKFVVVGLVTVFFVLPLLAIFFLTVLGRTVESEFVEVPIESGSSFDDGSVALPVEEPVGQTVVVAEGNYSLTVPPGWTAVGSSGDASVTTWQMPILGSANDLEVSAWSRSNDEALDTESIVEFEAAAAGLLIDSYQSAVVAGQPTVVVLYSPDDTLGAILVIHEGADGYAAALATSDIENVIFVFAEFELNLESLRYTG